MYIPAFKRSLLALSVAAAGLVACNNDNKTETHAGADSTSTTTTTTSTDTMHSMPMTDTASSAPADHALATLSGTKPDTTVNGTIKFDKDGSQVKMNLEITVPKLANKSVAVHLHDHGDCGNMGKDAMGHWNPTNENHGKWGSGQFHSGDIGNIKLDGQGKGTLQLTSNRWSLGGDAKTNILNRSVIVHSGVDDYTTQPSGNSGERIGCGVIQKTGSM